MSQTSSTSPATTSDPVSNVLKWILLAVAVVTFALLGWATFLTYERAPPQPERFVDTGGALLMSADDILAGKAGFQKADLMDFGSLYGMGSYYGQDYTAWALIRLAGLVEARVAQAQFGKTFEQLAPDQQAAVRNTMREQLQHIDLTQETVRVPDALATAIVTLRGDIAKELAATDLETGWTPAHSLNPAAAAAYCRVPDLLGADDRRASPERQLVVDRELALRAGGWQHADDQHLHLDLGELLLHLLRPSVSCCSSTSSG